jgi:Toprim domain
MSINTHPSFEKNLEPTKRHLVRVWAAEPTARLLGKAQGDGNGWWRCRCPICQPVGSHRKRGLLTVKDGANGRLAFQCYAGCHHATIEDALFDMGLLCHDLDYTPTIDRKKIREDEERERIKTMRARLMWLDQHGPEFVPFKGTLAETYLTEHRHLPSLPDTKSLGYWPQGNALVGLGYNDHGDLATVFVVYLDKDAHKTRKETRGFPKLHPVRLPSASGSRKRIIFAEGIETGLSVWWASGWEVWVCGGWSFMRHMVCPAECETVVIFGDNDNTENLTAKYEKAARWIRRPYKPMRQAQKERQVVIAIPQQAGYDANDFFQKMSVGEAVSTIRGIIRSALGIGEKNAQGQ